jgi:hypothetical protein
MTPEDKLSIFLGQFNCAAERMKKLNLSPSTNVWSLSVSSSLKTIHLTIQDGGILNPSSFILDGRKIDNKIYGIRNDYSGYMKVHYPYMQIEKQFGFKSGVLSKAFFEGFTNQPSYTNTFERGYDFDRPNYSEEYSTAFNLGRYLLDKYIGVKLPYKTKSFFK